MDTRDATDEELTALIAASALGDRGAFARLYARTSPQVFAVLVRTLGRREWAEEALQDAYVRVWQNASSFRPAQGRPITWIIGIARYRAVDLFRREQRHNIELRVTEDLADDGAIAPAAAPDDMAIGDKLETCLRRLEAQQRQAVLLAYCEGCSHRELARRLSRPLGTVKTWVRRGLEKLKECFDS